MMALVFVLLGAAIVGMVVAVAVMGWGGAASLPQRLGLLGVAGGLLAAAPGRFFGWAPGVGDMLFLGGLALYIGATYGPAVYHRADRELGGRLPGGPK